MKTKYILHGGNERWQQTEANKLFYQEMVKGIKRPKVLLVYFARGFDKIPELFKKDKENFAWANPEIKIKFILAEEEKFVDQVKNSNVIFLVGGDTQKLLTTLKKINEDLKKIFENRVVAGASAGVYVLSKWFYTNSGKEIRAGLGILPIVAWAHYRAERGGIYWLSEDEITDIQKGLKEKIGDGKLVLLQEQEMVVL
jgi:peptidase E